MSAFRYLLIIFSLVFFVNLSVAKDNLPEPVTWNTDLKDLVFDDDEEILDGSHLFTLESPYRALDAAMVPIKVHFLNENVTGKPVVKSLTLIVDENPSPVVGKFNFTKKSGDASLITRIRVDRYTYVRAIAEMSDNKKYMVANYVKAAGGCSAPSLADMDSIMARLGKMKLKFIKTGPVGHLNQAQLLISHPNYSGLQFNQLTRAEIPAHFINSIKLYQDNELILETNPDISLSEDPSITFNYINSGGPIVVDVEDSEGMKFAGEYPVSQVFSSK